MAGVQIGRKWMDDGDRRRDEILSYRPSEFKITHEEVKTALLTSIGITIDKIAPQNPNKRKVSEEDHSRSVRRGVLAAFEKFITKHKAYLLLNESGIRDLIDTIFLDELTTDVVFTLRTVFFSVVGLTDSEIDELINHCAKCIYIPTGENSLIKKDLAKRVSPTSIDHLYTFLRDNDYLLPLMLINTHLKISDIESL